MNKNLFSMIAVLSVTTISALATSSFFATERETTEKTTALQSEEVFSDAGSSSLERATIEMPNVSPPEKLASSTPKIILVDGSDVGKISTDASSEADHTERMFGATSVDMSLRGARAETMSRTHVADNKNNPSLSDAQQEEAKRLAASAPSSVPKTLPIEEEPKKMMEQEPVNLADISLMHSGKEFGLKVNKANLRSTASEKSPILKLLTKTDVIQVVWLEQNGWYLVKVGTHRGYVHRSLLQAEDN